MNFNIAMIKVNKFVQFYIVLLFKFILLQGYSRGNYIGKIVRKRSC